MRDNQDRMWTQGEDTPLFSGVCSTVRVQPFDPQPQAEQLTLVPRKCRLCNDTGSVLMAGRRVRCLCEAGIAMALARQANWDKGAK